jgi:hypothetical protein
MRKLATPALALSLVLSACQTFDPVPPGTPPEQVEAERGYCYAHAEVCLALGSLLFAGILIAVLPR